MKLALVSGLLCATTLAACTLAPAAGPQGDGAVLYDVVPVDSRVVATLLVARPKPNFAALFTPRGKPPPPKIAVGDRLLVVIWEAGPGGLFTAPLPALPAPPANPTIAPLEEPTPPHENSGTPGLDQLLGGRSEEQTAPEELPPKTGKKAQTQPAPPPATAASGAVRALVERQNRQGAAIPAQQVARDGTITIPYAGRIVAAGRTPAALQREIEARLATKAIEPQVLVIDTGGPAHTVTVAGEVVHGARVPLSPAGDRLLQVIAEAGGARAPVHDLFVRLSRGGVTATLPLAALVRDPAENIYAWPGDVLTLIRRPQTFSVFGAAKRNAQIPFGAATLTLGQAFGKAHWLREDIANARGVFLFRYEQDDIVRALGEPLAAGATGDVSPVVYRFNMKDPKSFLLAQRFPMRDKDIVFVVDADIVPLYKWFRVLSKITGPVEEGLIVCFTTKSC